MQERLQDANVYFEKALRLDPNNSVIRRNLAANQLQLGHLGAAKENLERILRVAPRDPPTILLLGMVAENLKDYRSAVDRLGSVPELVRQRKESLAALAHSYYRTNQGDKAREILKILQTHKSGQPAAFLAGQVAIEAEDYETAEKMLGSIQLTYADAVGLNYSLALVRYRTKRFSESQKTLLDLINSGHQTSDIYNLLGWCYERQDRIREAVRAFDQAIELEPLNENNYLDLGKILTASNLFAIAMAVVDKAVERLPKSYRVYMLKGLVQSRQRQHEEAIRSYRHAVDLNPSAPEADCEWAKELSKVGLTKDALAAYENGIKRFPHDAPHYQDYGLLLLQLAESGQAEKSRAVSMLERAIALNDSLAEPHYQLAILALREGRTHTALHHLQRAVSVDPEASKIHFALWRTYRTLGNSNAAMRELSISEKLRGEEEKRANRPLTLQAEP
jgi:superkiller protein 3